MGCKAAGRVARKMIKNMRGYRDMKKLLALFIAVILCFSLCNPITAFAASERGYTLTEVGNIPDENLKIKFDNGGAYYENADSLNLLNHKGEIIAENILGFEYLGQGLYTIVKSEDVNSTGLINAEGEELIPCEAAIIDWLYDEKDGRFLEVIYAENETDNKDECFLFATDRIFHLGKVAEGDTMYTGYSKVFDIEGKSFAENIINRNNAYGALMPVGNMVYWNDGSDMYRFYSADGELILETDNYVFTSEKLAQYQSEKYEEHVLNENGDIIFTLEDGYIGLIYGKGGYFYVEDESYENMSFYNSRGELLFTRSSASAIMEYEDLFIITVDGKQGLIDAKGNTVIDCKYESVSYIDLGIFVAENENGYSVYDKNGLICKDLDEKSYDSIYTDQSGKKLLVLNEGEFSYDLQGSDLALADGLIYDTDKEGMKSLVDLFTGKTLLEFEYERIYKYGEYIYAYKDKQWTVYELQFNNP